MSGMTRIQGERFFRLTAVEPLDQNFNSKTLWKCSCACGKFHTTTAGHLKSGNTKSCGCLRVDRSRELGKNVTHGMTKTPEYKAWVSMKQRCYNSKAGNYKDYGAKGVKVCDRWLNSFENFLEDMGLRPGTGYSLERREVTGNYEPNNCKWATIDEQNNNKRTNAFFEIDGEKLTLGQIAKKYDIPRPTLETRLRGGYSIQEAISKQTNKRLVTHKGETRTIGEWAKAYDINYNRLYNRLMAGLPFEIALLRG